MKKRCYLHTNGTIIFKHIACEIESDSTFVVRQWELDTEKRKDAWFILVEAHALGADDTQVAKLREEWGLTDLDGLKFLELHTPWIDPPIIIDRTKDGTWIISNRYRQAYGSSIFTALVNLRRDILLDFSVMPISSKT